MNMKGKALKRIMQTSEATQHRVVEKIPLITGKLELITPDLAHQYLQKNKDNRPVNWDHVKRMAEQMKLGKWDIHGQGIMFDEDGFLLNGQQRLLAITQANVSIYLYVVRGNPRRTANLIDRGKPQTSRDLAARKTGRRHSQIEASIARGVGWLCGQKKLTDDDIAAIMVQKQKEIDIVYKIAKGTKKTRAVMLSLCAIVFLTEDELKVTMLARRVNLIATDLTARMCPVDPEKCWGRGASFSLALEHAKKSVEAHLTTL